MLQSTFLPTDPITAIFFSLSVSTLDQRYFNKKAPLSTFSHFGQHLSNISMSVSTLDQRYFDKKLNFCHILARV